METEYEKQLSLLRQNSRAVLQARNRLFSFFVYAIMAYEITSFESLLTIRSAFDYALPEFQTLVNDLEKRENTLGLPDFLQFVNSTDYTLILSFLYKELDILKGLKS